MFHVCLIKYLGDCGSGVGGNPDGNIKAMRFKSTSLLSLSYTLQLHFLHKLVTFFSCLYIIFACKKIDIFYYIFDYSTLDA